MSGYYHAQQGTEVYTSRRCTKRHWWGWCKSYSTSYGSRGKSCTSNSGTWDVDFGAHSLSGTYSNSKYRPNVDGHRL